MPTVIVRDGVRVFVNIREHQPPHVHVDTGSGEVLAYLGEDGVSRHGHEPGVTKSDLRKAVNVVEAHLADCWAMWRRYHP
jgi:hypothetical protein